ncbi:ankyrin repeat-containing protein [Tokyovirus A1]|uniref:ankyrin repeat-containing protein n=1 Tax=Tokyovirus A1 TaxID=1826170 RepID=UPI0007A98B5F|nr:ankyrin repeat-containing protein [Tokyovirus A1]BAU80247.1 ankyrin repeat-containing protein [Tokyovirus A1]
MNLESVYPRIRDPRKSAFLAVEKASPRDLAIVCYVWAPAPQLFEFCVAEYEKECQKQWESFSKISGSVSELFSDTVQGLSSKHKKLERVLGLLNCIGVLLIASSYPEISTETASLKDKDKLFWSIKLPANYGDYIFAISDKKSLLNFCSEKKAKFWFSFLYKTATSERVRWLCQLDGEFLYFSCLLSSIQEINGEFFGRTPLMSTVARDDTESASLLLDFHACKNLSHPRCETNALGMTSTLSTFEFLMEKQVCPDIVDRSGFTFLSRLCGSKGVDRKFLKHVVDASNPNVPQKTLPLTWALLQGDEELLSWLFERGADPLFAERTSGVSETESEVWREAKRIWEMDIPSLKKEKSKIAKGRTRVLCETLQVKSEKCLWWLSKHFKSVSVREAAKKRNSERKELSLFDGGGLNFGEFSDLQILWFQEGDKRPALLSSQVQGFVEKESERPNPRYDKIDFFASRSVVTTIPLSSAIKLLE